jgi:hypothetical protein
MSRQNDEDWVAVKHAYIRFSLGFAMVIAVAVMTGILARWMFEPDGGPLSGWFELFSLSFALGFLAALPLLNSPTRNWRDTASAAAMGLIAGIQFLAGIAATVLVMSQWFPAPPDPAAYRSIPVVFGILMAAPVIFGTVVTIRRKNRLNPGGEAK